MSGPRLNAAGRLDTAKVSYDLLRSATVEAAQPLAQKLDEQNRERQRLLEAALVTARAEATQQVLQFPLIFVASEEYRAGIVGLVAGRLAEEFGRPAIAIERGADISRGSCRSIARFDIGQALEGCHDLFERHGGHSQAAGFTIRTERLPQLREQLNAVAQRELDGHSFDKVIEVDAVIPLNLADWQTLGWVQKMEPFGIGNPAPAFRSNGVRLRQVRRVGSDHLKLSVTDGRLTWPAIAFRQGARADELAEGDRVDLVYNLEDQTWNGEHTLQLVVKDLRHSTGATRR